MDKVIVTLLLIVGGIVCSLVIINAIYPAITGSSGAIIDAATKIDDRIRSNIEIIEMSHNNNEIYIWIKNIGASTITGINNSDIFFGPRGNFVRIAYGNSSSPYWDYTIENDIKWGPGATLKITIYYTSVPSGDYYFKIVIPNGITDYEYYST